MRMASPDFMSFARNLRNELTKKKRYTFTIWEFEKGVKKGSSKRGQKRGQVFF
jgi:hypothetical protein